MFFMAGASVAEGAHQRHSKKYIVENIDQFTQHI